MRNTLLAVALLSLAACGQTTTPAATTEAPLGETTAAAPTTREEATAQDACGAAAYRGMVGTNVAAIQLPADSGVRVIMPDTVVTQDFRADRANIIAGADGVITSVECF